MYKLIILLLSLQNIERLFGVNNKFLCSDAEQLENQRTTGKYCTMLG